MEKKKINSLLVIVLLLLISIIITTLIYFWTHHLEIKELKIFVNVANYTGFNLTNESLHFGTIRPGGFGERYVIISNNDIISKKVFLSLGGEVSKWIKLERREFIIKSNSSEKINIRINIPKKVEFGNYNGVLRITFLNEGQA